MASKKSQQAHTSRRTGAGRTQAKPRSSRRSTPSRKPRAPRNSNGPRNSRVPHNSRAPRKPRSPRNSRGTRTSSLSRNANASVATSRLSPGVRTGLLVSLILVLAMVGVFVFSNIQQVKSLVAQQNSDARLYSFNPGYIISDNLFFNDKAMDEEQVQTFLNTQGQDCQGEWCVKSHRFEVHAEEKDELCSAYTPPEITSTENRKAASPVATGAQVIMAAARSCRINPRALLVLLQKESGVVTMRNPSEKNYRYAMGLNCPDNAECDRRYAGFFNQVFGAARRFQYYRANPGQYQFSAQHVNSIRFNPNAACGSSKVYIENTATALLYIYTPYQPNRAALTGKPDSCSSFGNLNFARLWEQWFGARQ